MICLIVATAQNRVIGVNGDIPWRIPGELAYFKQVTIGHAVVMGRRTFESIGRPLPGRTNYVLTRDTGFQALGCHVLHDVASVLEIARSETVFVIGGAQVYNTFLPVADKVYQTVVHQDFEGDAFFPELDSSWVLVSSRPGPDEVLPHTFLIYDKASK